MPHDGYLTLVTQSDDSEFLPDYKNYSSCSRSVLEYRNLILSLPCLTIFNSSEEIIQPLAARMNIRIECLELALSIFGKLHTTMR